MLLVIGTQLFAQENKMDRIELAKKNYHTLFGGEALTGQGNDPEMMEILQKFIFGEVFQTGNLDMKTREMITCTALTAMQTLPQLKAHIEAALNVGVSPVEMRELIYLCAPFIGFPKTLNALSVANEIFAQRGVKLPLESQTTVTEENRAERGAAIQQPLYGDAVLNSLEGLPDGLGAEAARFLTEYGFGDIYSRGGLTLQTKELLIYALLISINADATLRSHTASNVKLGNDKATLCAVAIQCLPYVGFPPVLNALRTIAQMPQ